MVIAGQGGTSLWQWTPQELHESDELEDLYAVMKERLAFIRDLDKKGRLPKVIPYKPAKGFSTYRYPYFPSGYSLNHLVNIENWVGTRPARGVVFWQGENDVGISANYEPLFRGMLKRWRANATWDYPLIFIQLPTYTDRPGAASKMDGIAGLRDAQRRVARSEANTEMMVSFDIYSKGIHPAAKEAYGIRLAKMALGMVYEKDFVWRSPEFSNANVEEGRMVVSFSSVGEGLRAKQGEITGFTLAGEDGVFHPAKAEIAGKDKIVVMSGNVLAPVAVRYAWSKSPKANLVGDDDWPVSPFRSDDWELYPVPRED